MKKFLVVGLGNVGEKYANTRHNIGFDMIDELGRGLGAAFESEKHGEVARSSYKGRTCVLLKPNTFMNLSGKAVSFWMQQEKISLENLLVLTDDLNLPFGTLRIKPKGSDGGHNGLKDIQDRLGTAAYARFRFGIGNEFNTGSQVSYVLGTWNEFEQKSLKERLERSAAAIETFMFAGISEAMNRFNNT